MKVRTENIFKGSKKYSYLILFIVIFLVCLILRISYLQIINGEYFFSLSEKNRIRSKRIPPLRGNIYDINMNLIAANKPGFSLYINRADIESNGYKVKDVVGILSNLTNINKKDVENILKKFKNYPKFVPVKIKSNIDFKTLSTIKSYSYFLVGVDVGFDPIRFYPYKNYFAHVVGYVLESDKKDIKKYKGLMPGDYVGKTGIEREYNRILIGKSGKKLVEIDARGKELKVLSVQKPINGYNLVLSLRKDLQEFAYNLLKDKAGVIIAVNPNNGKILCMVSTPSFDPNDFAKGISQKKWGELVRNLKHPLSNKGVSGLYPPGSTFKVVTAIAGLLNHSIGINDTVKCYGTYIVGDTTYRCWKKYGHGDVNIVRAIKESCDVFFYDLGIQVGIDNIYNVASMFGLGYRTGLDLPGEQSGLVPSKEWKLRTYKIPWYPGETPPVAIGQGYTLVTPLQMLMLYSAIANNGILYQPEIVDKIIDEKGKIIEAIKPLIVRKLNIPKNILDIVKTGLKKVVNEPHGTAYSNHIKDFEFSGKTGTAQVRKLGEKRIKDINKIPYEQRDHAWFVAYAPSDNPQFAVVVFVEHGGHGGSAAAPLAREMIKYYFKIR